MTSGGTVMLLTLSTLTTTVPPDTLSSQLRSTNSSEVVARATSVSSALAFVNAGRIG
jgi:hypothetical protein